MYVLRPYQNEAVEKSVRFLKSPQTNHGIIILPTGSGKSLIIANIIKELGEPVLVFQPSKEILEQNFDKLLSYNFEATIYSASLKQKKISDITFATIGSVVKKAELFDHVRYVLVDECHLVNPKGGVYEFFLNELKNVKVLGLTATPYRLSTDGFGGSMLKFLTRTKPRIFSEVVYYIQNKTLFDAGFLAKIKYYFVEGFDKSKLRPNSTGADYTDESILKYYKEINFPDSIVRAVNKLLTVAGRNNVLIFTRFVYESEYLVANIPGAKIVTGETPKKEREKILKDFKAGKIKVVCNVGTLTVGFDYPELDTVVLARPTMSLALYYQMIGRAIRPHKDKEYAMILDMCENTKLFGHLEDFYIGCEGKEKWYIRNKTKQLTNQYFNRDE